MVVVLLFFSCGKKEISTLPFEVTKNVTCNDLYDNDFRRIYGVDVDLLGKKFKNIEVIYNLDHYNKEWNPEDKIEFKTDTILSKKYYEIYKNENWLEIPDSIYSAIWGKKEILKEINCNNAYAFARSYDIILTESEVINIRKTIDKNRFKIFDVYKNIKSKHQIETFKVLNLIKKDTFRCFTYKDEKGKFHFSTSIQYKDYD